MHSSPLQGRKAPDATLSAHTDAVFNEVLAAEARARDLVEGCRQNAAALRTAASEEARAIASRTDQRMRRTHELADAALARGLRELLGPGTDTASPPAGSGPLSDHGPGDHPPSIPGLDQAIAHLIDELLAPPADGQPP